jgi:hypothetical protein
MLAVEQGTLYVGTAGSLMAFDAAGVDGCSGTPKTCTALWSASQIGDPNFVVAGGFVYTSSGLVFDAAGEDGCSGMPRTCAPLWGAAAGKPAVANGMLYMSRPNASSHTTESRSTQRAACSAAWTAHERRPLSVCARSLAGARGAISSTSIRASASFSDGEHHVSVVRRSWLHLNAIRWIRCV